MKLHFRDRTGPSSGLLINHIVTTQLFKFSFNTNYRQYHSFRPVFDTNLTKPLMHDIRHRSLQISSSSDYCAYDGDVKKMLVSETVKVFLL
jgi:hypothetical protein